MYRGCLVGIIVIIILHLYIAGKSSQLLPDLLFKSAYDGYGQYHHAKAQHDTDDRDAYDQFRVSAVRLKGYPG